jgi:hypothetical protein
MKEKIWNKIDGEQHFTHRLKYYLFSDERHENITIESEQHHTSTNV